MLSKTLGAPCLKIPSSVHSVGDVGHYDSDGFVYLVDRIKDLIKYKGYQVG